MPSMHLVANITFPQSREWPRWGPISGRELSNLVNGVVLDGKSTAGFVYGLCNDKNPNQPLINEYVGFAGARLTLATATGAVGATIGGTLVTATAAGGDTPTAELIAAAIRNSPIARKLVTATTKSMRFTFVAVPPVGTRISFGGASYVAITAGTTPRRHQEFALGADVTATALNFVNAVNRGPHGLRYFAVSVAGVVDVALSNDRATSPGQDSLTVQGLVANVTVQKRAPINDGNVFIIAAMPGAIGNEVRAVASGTGVTIATNGAAGLLGGGNSGSDGFAFSVR